MQCKCMYVMNDDMLGYWKDWQIKDSMDSLQVRYFRSSYDWHYKVVEQDEKRWMKWIIEGYWTTRLV